MNNFEKLLCSLCNEDIKTERHRILENLTDDEAVDYIVNENLFYCSDCKKDIRNKFKIKK